MTPDPIYILAIVACLALVFGVGWWVGVGAGGRTGFELGVGSVLERLTDEERERVMAEAKEEE
jgi:hypothetical protein